MKQGVRFGVLVYAGLSACLLGGCAGMARHDGARSPSAAQEYKALPVPSKIIVASSGPRVELWKSLPPRQQKLAYYLIRAARSARPILFLQNHRYGLVLKQVIESALSKDHIFATRHLLGDGPFREFLGYAAKFEDLASPYGNANRKYILTQVTPAQVRALIKNYAPADSESVREGVREDLVSLLTDPILEVIQYPESEDGMTLSLSGGNLYEYGLTGAEVVDAVKAGLKSQVNCRIVRDPTGKIACQIQALSTPDLPPEVRSAMQGTVDNLRLALPFALTRHQKRQIQLLIRYLEKGNVEDFKEYNRQWVKDRSKSSVDFMMSYIESYTDFLNLIGSWESYVQIVDPKTTALSIALAKNAQKFEDEMPYGKFKKKFPRNYSPPALMVYYFQEIAEMRSGGYNLPNYEDIRVKTGAKNVIKLPLPGEEEDPQLNAIKREWLTEFLPPTKVENAVKLKEKIWRTLVLLHEIIGHGSGTYDPEKYKGGDPIASLKALGSSMEEQRADLAALVFASDPILVKVGLYKDQAEADLVRTTLYDFYMADFLRRLSSLRTVTEAHQRGHWLLVNLLLQSGAVKFVAKDGSAQWTPQNFAIEVVDYQKFWQVSHDLLGELQRIKATRDEDALRKLYAEHAPLDVIQTDWAQGVIARGADLAVNSGNIEQPWDISPQLEFKLLGSALTLEGVAPIWSRF